MNQEQRKFLIERVNKTFQKQKSNLEAQFKKEPPSLNNYLVSAFLENTIEFNDIEKLKVKMKEMVLKYGASDRLVRETKDRWDNTGVYKNKNTCEIITEDLFIIPESYKIALSEYEESQKIINDKISELEAQRDTILLKIQIGSNQILDKLVTQVDNLADLNIMNNQFLLS